MTEPPRDQPYTIPIIIPGAPIAPAPASPPPEPPPVRSSHPGWVVPVVAALAVLVLAGAGGVAYLVATRPPPAQPATAASTRALTTAAAPTTRPAVLDSFTVSGLFSLIDDDEHWKVGADCEGDGGFSDIHIGADVVVSASGVDLATASLFGGNAQQQGGHVVCKFAFFLVGVPAGKGVYTLTIGHRSSKLNEDELRRELDLSLGG